MKPEWRRFAPVGLILALLAALFSAGLYIVQREWNLALQISLAFIPLGLAIFVILDPDRVRRALTGRQARYGSNALILIIAFVTIVVVLNYLIIQNSQRWDLTEDQEFTLSTETLQTLESLPEPVVAQAFFTQMRSPEQAQGLLDQYKFNGNDMFDFQFIDPDAEPVMAEAAGITRDGSVVLVMGDDKQIVENVNEQELTGALVRLINPEEHVVYFLTGHGEYDPNGTGEKSYSQIARFLESKNYSVKTINLLSENQIPEDAALVVIAGPQKPVSQGEIELLEQFSQNGGGLIIMQEPLPVTDFGDQPDPMVDYLAENWGIVLLENIVIDTTSQQPFAPYAAQYGNHAITRPIASVTSQYPTVRSVNVGNVGGEVSLVELVLTSDQSWAETDLAGLAEGQAEISFTEGADQLGPISLAVTGERMATSSGRLAVFGDSDFVSNDYLLSYANIDVFVNTVDWVAGEEELISLTPKQTTQRTVLPPQTYVLNFIFLGTVIVLPGLALVAGIVVWVQRRRRG
jgi:ABC-type uncharacterized transport system involved in gliding motility auxiliary subunit